MPIRDGAVSPDMVLARLTAAVRSLVEATVRVSDATVASAAAAEVERLVTTLATHSVGPALPRHPTAIRQPPAPGDLMPFDLVVGPLNPLAPPIVFRWEGDKSVGLVTFTLPYEGPPGCVHGGILAAAFDQTLSIANVMTGVAGPTAHLTVRYRKPTPLGVPLRFEGWQTRVVGRRIHAAGHVLADGTVTAEAEGTFVQLDGGRVMRMLDPDAPGRS